MGGVVSEAIEGVGLFLCVGERIFVRGESGQRRRCGWGRRYAPQGGGKCLEAFV